MIRKWQGFVAILVGATAVAAFFSSWIVPPWAKRSEFVEFVKKQRLELIAIAKDQQSKLSSIVKDQEAIAGISLCYILARERYDLLQIRQIERNQSRKKDLDPYVTQQRSLKEASIRELGKVVSRLRLPCK